MKNFENNSQNYNINLKESNNIKLYSKINKEENSSKNRSETNRIILIKNKNKDKNIIDNYEYESIILNTQGNKDNKSEDNLDINLDENLNFSKFQEEYINQLNNSYKKQLINDEQNNSNEFHTNLIKSYFNNELIDENYVNNYTYKDNDKINNSILYKKYILQENDKSFQFKQIFKHMFCSFRLFKCLYDCCSCKKENKTFNNYINKKNIENFKYQDFWNYGLNLILFEVTGFFLISQIVIILYILFNVSSEEFSSDDDNNDNSVWKPFYSNEYKCIQFNINDLLNDDFSFNITCIDDRNFFYISKFGVSPSNEEGKNIAGCFSTSFKNLINIDSDCDLTNYLEEKLKEYKYKEADIEINIKEMNIKNEIINNCKNKNNRDKFFLSYSCYIPYIITNQSKEKDKNKEKETREEFLSILILFEAVFFFLNYLSLFYHSNKFSQAMKLNSIKSITLMIDNIDIEKDEIPLFLNKLLISINNQLIYLNQINQNDLYYSLIRGINFSFLNPDEKDFYDKLNYLLRKRIYLIEKIKAGDGNKDIPRNLIFTIISKLCRCFKITYQTEYEQTEKELKKMLIKNMENKETHFKLKKIYITFSKYEIKRILKNQKILINNEYFTLKKSDMSPHDINWENLNIEPKEKLKRKFISYILLIVFVFVYFLIIIIISIAQNSFQRTFNLLTDCSNVDYKNNYNLIYEEYINEEQSEKEKVYKYCFCKYNSKKEKITYNEITFDPCIDYNKYKIRSQILIYLMSFILSVLNLVVDLIVDKIISIQRFESKSNQNNLNIIITIIILLFTNIFCVIVINAKITDKNISKYFGNYEDITPQWINEMSANVVTNLSIKLVVSIVLNLIYVFFFSSKGCCYRNFYYYILFLTENPIIHFYNYFKIYAPEKNYIKYSSNIIFFIFNVGILIFSPFDGLLPGILLMIQAILSMFHNTFLNSFSYVLNKMYFKIIFSFIVIFLVFHTLLEIWFFSSEYFFIDIREDVYKDFFGSNKKLIDKFIKGDASISEKIKVKLLLKRNVLFYLQLIIIIIMEIIRLLYCQNKKDKNNKKFDESLLEIDDYSKIKSYEFYRLLYNKFKNIPKNDDGEYEVLNNFLKYKYNEYKNDILKDEEIKENENEYEIIKAKKNKMIEENNIFFNNPDFTYSPFLLDEYNISFISKSILSSSFC